MLTRVVVFRYCVYQNFSSFHSTRSFSLFETIHEKMRKIVATIESWRTEEEKEREREKNRVKTNTWKVPYMESGISSRRREFSSGGAEP